MKGILRPAAAAADSQSAEATQQLRCCDNLGDGGVCVGHNNQRRQLRQRQNALPRLRGTLVGQMDNQITGIGVENNRCASRRSGTFGNVYRCSCHALAEVEIIVAELQSCKGALRKWVGSASILYIFIVGFHVDSSAMAAFLEDAFGSYALIVDNV